MADIFISYRRADNSGTAGRIYDKVKDQFGAGSVFFDVQAIHAGQYYKKKIEDALATCRAFILVIGPRWLTLADENGRRLLDHPDDFVLLEIANAVKAGAVIIPTLVDGAEIPQAKELPLKLEFLVDLQFVELRHKRFDAEISDLLEEIRLALDQANGAPDTLQPMSPSQPASARINAAASSGAAPGRATSKVLPADGSSFQRADSVSRNTTLRGAIGELDGAVRPGRKSWLPIMLAVGATAVVGVVLSFVVMSSRAAPPPIALSQDESSGEPSVARSRLATGARSGVPRGGTAVQEIQFHLESDPPGAKVSDARSGELLGVTPLDRNLPHEGLVRSLVVAKEGYLSANVEVPITSAFAGKIVLKPVPASKRHPKVSSATSLPSTTPVPTEAAHPESPSQASAAKPFDPAAEM